MPEYNFKIRTNLISVVIFFSILALSLFHSNLLIFVLLLISLAIHELSHIFCSELLGYRVEELSFNPLGGCLRINPSFLLDPLAETIIALAGPISNFLLATGVIYLKLLGIQNQYLQFWGQVNLLLGTVNLIPVLPLDGSKLLHAYLNKKWGLSTSTYILRIISIVLGVLFLGLGINRIISDSGGAFYFLLGIFTLLHALYFKKPDLNLLWRSLQHKRKQRAKKGFLTIKPIFVLPETLLRVPLQYYGTNENLLFFLQDNQQKMHIINEDLAWTLLIENGFDTTFKRALLPETEISINRKIN